ncbi:MAG: adenylyltransferase/cytidyltransferase family protein [Selenomonas sp.]
MYQLGYTQGVFDMFHIGHLNLINHAKQQCKQLIVGVNADALVEQYKHKTPVIPEANRKAIVENLKAVDRCEVVTTLDKIVLYRQWKFDAIFIGDDWRGNERWRQTEIELARFGVKVIYLPYTHDISSTKLKGEVGHRVDE